MQQAGLHGECPILNLEVNFVQRWIQFKYQVQ